MVSNKSQGACLNNIETSPKEHVKAITLRSGRHVEGKPQNGDEKTSKSTPSSLEQLPMNEEKKQEERKPDLIRPYVPLAPFFTTLALV